MHISSPGGHLEEKGSSHHHLIRKKKKELSRAWLGRGGEPFQSLAYITENRISIPSVQTNVLLHRLAPDTPAEVDARADAGQLGGVSGAKNDREDVELHEEMRVCDTEVWVYRLRSKTLITVSPPPLLFLTRQYSSLDLPIPSNDAGFGAAAHERMGMTFYRFMGFSVGRKECTSLAKENMLS